MCFFVCVFIQFAVRPERNKRKLPHTNFDTLQNRKCVRCPKEISVVAPQVLDGVYIVPPASLSCKTNLPFVINLYKMETLFGSELQFVLPQGHHSFIAFIRDVENGLIVNTCHLKYNIIVRRCQ